MGDGICKKLFFGLFLVTMDQKFVLYMKKSAENGQFTMKVMKKWSLWAISRKAAYSRYGTKIKNCSGFMRVHRILKVWSLLTTKIIISPQ